MVLMGPRLSWSGARRTGITWLLLGAIPSSAVQTGGMFCRKLVAISAVNNAAISRQIRRIVEPVEGRDEIDLNTTGRARLRLTKIA
jgi:hypothetical protein